MMPKRLFLFDRKSFFVAILIFIAVFSSFFVVSKKALAITEEEQKAEWQAELDQLNADIAKNQAILNSTKANTASLQQAAAVLNAQIAQDKLLIKQKNIAIAQLDQDIADKNKNIESLEQKISDGHDSLSQLLRQTNEVQSYSLVEVMLANQNISDFFSDIDTFQSINKSLADLFVQIRATKDLTEKEKAALQVQQNKETDTKVAAQQQQTKTQADEKQKEYLISVSKTQEKTYAQVLADQQARAAQIRAALFNLRDAAAIPFGEALKYAQEASAKTGVRPAFLLAIITQESNLGQNIGQCVVTDLSTGDGFGKNTKTTFEQIMKAPRDTVPFQAITTRLSISTQTPVSCPPSAKWTSSRGYGGGMGPSQFIPSTWELFKNRIGDMIGIPGDSADPWNPEHAFMATAIYIQDLGAVAGSYTAERNAACKYYSGSNCSSTRRPPNAFYGDNVMKIAQDIQTNMIDQLNF